MKISVVIPAYNEERYVGACLKSIFLGRIPELAEVIVVNNASTDNTANVVARFPEVRLLNEPERGPAHARRRGFLEAKSDLVGYIDADCRIPKRWLEIAKQEFDHDPSLVSLSGPLDYYDLAPLPRFFAGLYWKFISIPTYYLVGYMALGGNMVAKREALEKAGGFDTSIDFYGDDTDLARRLARLGKVKYMGGFFTWTSARRISKEGLFTMACKYSLNFFWIVIFHKPYSRGWEDIR